MEGFSIMHSLRLRQAFALFQITIQSKFQTFYLKFLPAPARLPYLRDTGRVCRISSFVFGTQCLGLFNFETRGEAPQTQNTTHHTLSI